MKNRIYEKGLYLMVFSSSLSQKDYSQLCKVKLPACYDNPKHPFSYITPHIVGSKKHVINNLDNSLIWVGLGLVIVPMIFIV